jgi:hypothetical protein
MQRIRRLRLGGILAVAGLGIGMFFLRAEQAIPVRVIIVESADEAGRILERLKGGADFAVLAREKSVDATAADGGFMGEVDPSTLRAELRDALDAGACGEPGRIDQDHVGAGERKAD